MKREETSTEPGQARFDVRSFLLSWFALPSSLVAALLLGAVMMIVLGVNPRTGYHALVTAGGLEPDQWVVVLGAAGGVGTATIDIAVRLGARVIAAASSPERLAVCKKLGAEAGIDYTREDLKLNQGDHR